MITMFGALQLFYVNRGGFIFLIVYEGVIQKIATIIIR